MFSFAKIATFAGLAFGALASAVPIAPSTSSPAGIIRAFAPSSLNLTAIATNATGVTANATLTPEVLGSDMSTILTNLKVNLMPQVQLLNAITAETATNDTLEAIIQEIASIIQAAVDAALGLPAGSVGSGNILTLLADILNIILAPFGTIFNLPGVDASSLEPLLDPLGGVLAALVAVVLSLVGGLLVVIVPLLLLLLGPILPILLGLGGVLAPLLAILLI